MGTTFFKCFLLEEVIITAADVTRRSWRYCGNEPGLTDLEALQVFAGSDARQQQQFGRADRAGGHDHFRRRLDHSLLTFVLKRDAGSSLPVEQNL